MENPFLKKDDTEETVVDPAAEEQNDDELSAAEAENELFDDESESDDEDEAASLFDEDESEKKIPEKVPYKRLQKVVGQRNELRQQIGQLEKALDANKQLVAVFHEKYGKFDNPAAIAKFDADFMEAIEALSKDNQGVARFAESIKDYLKTGRVPNVSEEKQTFTSPQNTTPKEDPKVAKLVERDARNTVEATLEAMDVKPAFRALIADHVVKQEDVDLTDLSKAQVVDLAKQFIKSKGFKAAEILQTTSKKKGKPSTTSGSSRAVTKESDETEEEEDRPPAAKSLEEWHSNREKMRRSLRF